MTDGRIVSAGPASPAALEALAALPAGTEVVAAEGRWIVPGLIDAHVHAESDAELSGAIWATTSG